MNTVPIFVRGTGFHLVFFLESNTVNSWDDFEKMFLEKFRDDSTLEDLIMNLSSLRIKGKERVKKFNWRFSYLKNRIPTSVLPTKELLVAYYIKGLPI